MTSTGRNPSLRRMEKEIKKEAKAEEDAVKRELKNLSRMEKEARKAQKSACDADTTLSRRERYEHKTAKVMNSAIHEHDIATTKLQAAERDVKLAHDHRAKLIKELEVRKGAVESAIQKQAEHDRTREKKIAEMQGLPASPMSQLQPNVASKDVGLPGQSGPGIDNSGRAAGYGVDFNHTIVDAEGNARSGVNHNGGLVPESG
ncbi:hypothetical protein P691DRAFT_756757 [Macrolepiota fuliginosa MF-IS2]|uniref:Uncharacterized protein n=1 Tax=Macrolepiota fuliginosa MF-IS2 TaxID=1400762 RepID=A0A9P5XJR7_9AGAR|nr:hypothetical protein P691DRAFT_756757 [Macrolepiota fuliginosa MF-IS2]